MYAGGGIVRVQTSACSHFIGATAIFAHEALHIAIVLSPFILLPVAGWMGRENQSSPPARARSRRADWLGCRLERRRA